MNSKQIIGLIGSIIVLIGIFLPIIRTPSGAITTYMFSPDNVVAGVLLVVLALLGLLGAYYYHDVILLTAAGLGTVVFYATFIHMLDVLGNIDDLRTIFIANQWQGNRITEVSHAGTPPVNNQYSIPDLPTAPKVAKAIEARLPIKFT